MVDAVSLSGNSYRAASSALASRIAESRPAAAEALAALSRPQPVTTVSTPSDAAEEIGDLAFLYAPNGQPGLAAQPASAIPATQATADAHLAAERRPSTRLAVESTDLDALMSSFLTARTPSANPAPSPDVPAAASNEQLALAARQSVINQLYNQF
ncbi:hypothetical protein [Shinella sp.]|uniref:hypothetical protein n=1 Tax=Shinella sp. TaxID=1870904 RepID=UPI0039E2D26D